MTEQESIAARIRGDRAEKRAARRRKIILWCSIAVLFVFAIVLVFDLRQVLPLASFYLLVWFAITHFSALHLKKQQRLTSPFFSWFGLAGCFVLLFFIPPVHLILGVVTLALAFIARSVVQRAL